MSLKDGSNIIKDSIHEIRTLLEIENLDYLSKTLNLPYSVDIDSIVVEVNNFIYLTFYKT